MVIWAVIHGNALGLLAAARPVDPVIEQLDPPRRAAVVMALIGIVLTGLALVACAMLGANWVRRMARHQPRTTRVTQSSTSPAENLRLRDSLRDVLPADETRDTVNIEKELGETKVDP
jgi:hypothetical protein